MGQNPNLFIFERAKFPTTLFYYIILPLTNFLSIINKTTENTKQLKNLKSKQLKTRFR